jgi:hypothetical protein
VIALLRREFGECAFNRFFGYDSPRWELEIARRVGMAGDRDVLRKEFANREFRDWSIGWAREVRTMQSEVRTMQETSGDGLGLRSAARELASSSAAAWLDVATSAPDADDPSLNKVRRLLRPGTEMHRKFVNQLTHALHQVVKPHLDAVEPVQEFTEPHHVARLRPPRPALRAKRRDMDRAAALLSVVREAAQRARDQSKDTDPS